MNQEEIPSADEFLNKYQEEYFAGAVFGEFAYPRGEVTKAMIDFAKAHVKKALENVNIELNRHSHPNDYGQEVFYLNSEVVKNAYPEENIK